MKFTPLLQTFLISGFRIYLLLLILVFAFQEYLLFFPGKNRPEASWVSIMSTSQTNVTLGYHIKRNDSKKVIVIFHGNAGSAADRGFYVDLFKTHNIVIAEYPTYGANASISKTTWSLKTNMLDNAHELMTHLKVRYTDMVIVGESIGTGVASDIVSKDAASKLLLITPYSSIEEVASDKYKFLPVSLLLKNKFDNVAALSTYQGNVLMILSENDEVIPWRFGHRLAERITSPHKAVLTIPKAGHNTWYGYMSDEQKKVLMAFVD